MRKALRRTDKECPRNFVNLLFAAILACLSLQAVQAQVNDFVVKDMPVRQAIEKFQADYGYSISVKVNGLDMGRKVTVKTSGGNALDVVKKIFTGQDIECAMDGNIISVEKKVAASIVQQKPADPQAAPTKTITGRVTDENKEPIMGATIVIRGAQTGIISDTKGEFQLRTSEQEPVLEVGYLGYDTEVVKLRPDQTTVNITMLSSLTQIDDVVVVGYGTQQKVNLTGSVSSITMDEKMAARSVGALSSMLSGLATGLSVVQNSGMAGGDDASLMIRGIGTVNNAAPLVVVDDMPDADINMVNMNDVESISVLKDASAAAVYGSRAANGVILIKTKSGSKSRFSTSVNISHAFELPINPYSFMDDYARVMTLYRQVGGVNKFPNLLTFKEGAIDQWLAMQNIDPLRYPSTDWWDLIMRNGSTTNYNVSMSGSNDKSKFYASVGIMDKKGLQICNDYIRYNARFNYSYNVRKNLTVETKFDGSIGKQKRYDNSGFGNEMLQTAIAGMTPYDPATGRYGGTMAYGESISTINPLAVFENCVSKYDKHLANISGAIDWSPVKGLSLRADYSMRYYNNIYQSANTPVQAYNFQTGRDIDHWYIPSNEGVHHNTENGFKTMFTARAAYNKTFAKHHKFSALVLYSEEFWWDRTQNSYRGDNLHPSLSGLDSTLPNIQQTSGNIGEEGLQSVVGRLNYNAWDRYLFEINVRMDSSSKFRKGNRTGVFPSASFGWRFSEEKFIKNTISRWLSNGKLRVSYGTLGNNSGVGRYEQQSTLTTRHYVKNGQVLPGFVNMKMINKDLSWETTVMFNAGIDLGFFNNSLTLEVDYYDRLTKGMIRPTDLSYLLLGGTNPERVNIGNLRNRGIEFTVGYKGRINQFQYNAKVNFSHNASRLEKWNEQYRPGYQASGLSGIFPFVDMPWGYVYGYRDNGIAKTWADVHNATPQGATPGDILRVDVNGDGQITDADRVPYPNKMNLRPTTDFSLQLGGSWKGLDFSMLFAGSAGRWDYWLNAYNNTNFSEGSYATSWLHWNDVWTANNRTGHMPKLGDASNVANSSYWLENMAFLRLKNLQVGYNITAKFLKTLGFSNIRVYFSAENLFTITNYSGMDPEKIGNKSDTYPQIRSYSMGITVNL